jgi:hypothetical protein
MNYEDQVAIGTNLNAAIQQTLREYRVGEAGIDIQDGELVGALAQAVLVQLDRAGYQIVRK